jgi:glyoxylase-like metal-dependent hydrolase (beta-lactamase superfamily II)
MLAAVMVVFFLFSSYTAFAQEGLKKIADGVYAYADVKNGSPKNSFGANAGIIIDKDGIVVVDTLISAKEAKRFIRNIRAVSMKLIKLVVNTHYHLDHAFGNSEFTRLGAMIIAQSADNANMRNKGEYVLKNAGNFGLTKEDLKGTELAYPALAFNDKMEINLGSKKIHLIFTGPSHTEGSILVYLPDSKVLFTGDVLFTDRHPYMGEADVDGWIKALDFILGMDVVTIIPGHGPISSKKDIADMKNYLTIFDKKAKELCMQLKDPDAIAAELKKVLPARSENEGFIKINIQMKYLKK